MFAVLLLALLAGLSRGDITPSSRDETASINTGEITATDGSDAAPSNRAVEVLRHCLREDLPVSSCHLLFSSHRQDLLSLEGAYEESLRPDSFRATLSEDTPQYDPNKESKKQQKVAIIGAYGYIGSRLHEYLRNYHEVTGYDRQKAPYEEALPVVIKSAREMSSEEIRIYDVIVYLGGYTGRRDCLSHTPEEVFRENIWDPFRLASKMTSSQLLIFASTSAINEGSGEKKHQENSTVEWNNLDEYSRSMLEREGIISQLSYYTETPRLVGLRFGSVVGYSKSQRLNLAHIAMMRFAYTSGYINVLQPDANRAVLGMNDLVRSVDSIIRDKNMLKYGIEIFNLSSFNCKVEAIAIEVASAVRVPVIIRNTEISSNGFSLDTKKFSTLFSFEFAETSQSLVQVLLKHFPETFIANGIHDTGRNLQTVSCQVCGKKHLQEVLDLHHQPLANSFMPSVEEALVEKSYPLKLMRCPTCNHVQLSHIVDRSTLFKNYLYQSNTSSTLLKYFEWLADKIISESSVPSHQTGTVIEIACNDGSQLDFFRNRGWRTIGVDPAQNLIPFARSKGHEVYEGFWGSEGFDMKQLPEPGDVDVIVAQNVLAHVETPVEFLKSCARAMSSKTKLYIQTSQCEMIFEGQFDTAYHEHISFFSTHSFLAAAKLAGLHMTGFEETPVHGISCLVTFELPSTSKSINIPGSSVMERLDTELAVGINSDVFYHRFKARALQLEQWIVKHLSIFSAKNYMIGGYGAAAKGIVLLHFIKKSSLFSFIVDDAPLKNGLFCPGTDIPVWNTTQLTELRDSTHPLVLVIFAWNFWTEISNRLHHLFEGSGKSITCIIPFPIPSVVTLPMTSGKLNSRTIHHHSLASLPKNSFSLSGENSVKTFLILPFYNSASIFPYWIRHHAHLFDDAILIDYHSTDNSVSTIRHVAPSSWRVVSSKNERWEFANKSLVEEELLTYAMNREKSWIFTMGVHEFLMASGFRNTLGLRGINTSSLVHIPRLFAFSLPNVTLQKFDTSVIQKHSTIGIASDRTNVVQSSTGSLVYKATVDSELGCRTATLGSSEIESTWHQYQNKCHNPDTIDKNMFIIDYIWQNFEFESGHNFFPLANMMNMINTSDPSVHLFPEHLMKASNLDSIHDSYVDEKLLPYVKTFHDARFAEYLEL